MRNCNSAALRSSNRDVCYREWPLKKLPAGNCSQEPCAGIPYSDSVGFLDILYPANFCCLGGNRIPAGFFAKPNMDSGVFFSVKEEP